MTPLATIGVIDGLAVVLLALFGWRDLREADREAARYAAWRAQREADREARGTATRQDGVA